MYHANRRQESGRSENEAAVHPYQLQAKYPALMFVYIGGGGKYGEFRPSVQDVTVYSVLPPKLNQLPVFSVAC